MAPLLKFFTAPLFQRYFRWKSGSSSLFHLMTKLTQTKTMFEKYVA